MPSHVVKCAPGGDEYVYWSDIAEAPRVVGTRAEVAGYMVGIGHGDDLDARFDRADRTGTSALSGFYDWSDTGPIAQQRGVVPRDRLGEFSRLYLADDNLCWALLESFEDSPECDEPVGGRASRWPCAACMTDDVIAGPCVDGGPHVPPPEPAVQEDDRG
jgi:hypothetical protein